MADAYGAISPQVNAQKKAILEAVASGGTKGLQAYEQAQQEIASSKDDAVGRTKAIAGLIGGPESQGFEAPIVRQFDTRMADLGQRRAGFSEDMARLGVAGQTALSSLGALAPLMKQKDQQSLAQSVRDTALKDWEARSLGQAEMDEQSAANAAANAEKAFSENEKAIDNFNKRIQSGQKAVTLGNDVLGRVVVDLQKKGLWDAKRQRPKTTSGPDYEKFQDALRMRDGARQILTEVENSPELGRLQQERASRQEALNAALGATKIPRSDRARRIATDQFGVEPQLALGKLGAEDIPKARQPGSGLDPYSEAVVAKAKLTPADWQAVQADKDYTETRSTLEQVLGVYSWEQAERLINLLPANKRRSKALLRAEFKDQFQTASQLKKAKGE